MFSICVLTYGDHADLVMRCLSSLARTLEHNHHGLVTDLRIGLNAPSKQTLDHVYQFAKWCPVPCHLYSEKTERRNVLKYPLMSRMLWAGDTPVGADAVMWFDDDSLVLDSVRASWIDDAAIAWIGRTPAVKVMGSIYNPGYRWTPREVAHMQKEPWFTDKALLSPKLKFATGGWWVADTQFLKTWNYPVPPLKHNGGDVLLGEICRQQGAEILSYKAGVGINYDKAKGGESRHDRRGVTSPRPFDCVDPSDLSHHAFEVRIESFTPKEPASHGI